ncbi:MAG: PQQ-dependent sugar dehydrogenase [Halioglobus sp.]
MRVLRASLLCLTLVLSGCDRLEFEALKLYLHFNQNLKIEDGKHYFESGEGVYSVSAVYEGLEFPWDMAFLSESEILVTEKPGRLTKIDLDTRETQSISGVPVVSFSGQGGLLGIALHPNFQVNQLIYLSYTASVESGENQIQLLKARLVDNMLLDPEIIFRALPVVEGLSNLGGALAIDPIGSIYLSVGEHQSRDNLQSRRSHLGTIIRLNDDGSIPGDNPFVQHTNSYPEIYSYGHRNPQGMTIDPTNNSLWAVEHGPKGGDELNVIRAGKNYGWPMVSYGTEYDGSAFAHTGPEGMFEEPLVYYKQSIAPAGLLFYSGEKYPDWKDHFLIGSLIGTHVNLVGLKHGAIEKERLLGDLKMRIRGLRLSPEGHITILTENGIILRVEKEG